MKDIFVKDYRLPCDDSLVPAMLRALHVARENGYSSDDICLIFPSKEEPAEPLSDCPALVALRARVNG